MSEIKEKIISAVSIMNDEDAQKLWNRILTTFTLENVEEVEPDSDETEILAFYKNGDPELQPAYTSEEVLRILGIK